MRKPIAMTENAETITVLCDDGTVWYTKAEMNPKTKEREYFWAPIWNGPIPGTPADFLCLAPSEHSPPVFCNHLKNHEHGRHSWEV